VLMRIGGLYRSYPLQDLPEARSRVRAAMKKFSDIYANLPAILKQTYDRWVSEEGQFDIHYEAGKQYLEAGEYPSAVRELSLSLKSHPGHAAITKHLEEARQKLLESQSKD